MHVETIHRSRTETVRKVDFAGQQYPFRVTDDGHEYLGDGDPPNPVDRLISRIEDADTQEQVEEAISEIEAETADQSGSEADSEFDAVSELTDTVGGLLGSADGATHE